MNAGLGIFLVCITAVAEDAKLGPPAGTLSLFPSLEWCEHQWTLQQKYLAWITEQRLGEAPFRDPNARPIIVNGLQMNGGSSNRSLLFWMIETKVMPHRQKIYTALLAAHQSRDDTTAVRGHLRNLRRLLGERDFWRGELPGAVPWEDFEEWNREKWDRDVDALKRRQPIQLVKPIPPC